MLLQSMSLNPDEYGWTVGVHGYEPVPTLDPMAGSQAVIVMEIAAHNGAVARRTASSVSQHAEFAKALHAKIASMMAS